MSGNTLYVIDSSSLIDMALYYPVTSFPTLWKRCDELITQRRLSAPIEVLRELEKKDDEIADWAKERRNSLFLPYTRDLLDQVKIILEDFPRLINPHLDREQADPFVIAMALDRRDGPQQELDQFQEICVITEEKTVKNQQKTKIPEVCRHYGLPCISMVEMIVKEGWKF